MKQCGQAGSRKSTTVADIIAILQAYAAGTSATRVKVNSELLETARQHAVLGVVCGMCEGGRPGAQVRRSHAVQSMQQEHALSTATAALARAEVESMVLKGPVLAEVVYRTPGVREYSDIDLLVRPEAFESAVEVLVGAGAELLEANWPLIRRQLRGELALMFPGGVPIDLHWHVVNDPLVRSDLQITTASLFDLDRKVRLGQGTVRTLDEVGTAVYTAVHAWKSGGNRLKWMLDVQQCVARVGAEAPIRERARTWGVEVPVLLMLRRAERTIGWMPARAHTDRLGMYLCLWLALDRLIDPFTGPLSRSSVRGPSGLGLLRAARDSGVAARGALMRSVAAAAHRRVLGPGSETQTELRRTVHSPPDRAAYFAAVRRHGRSDRDSSDVSGSISSSRLSSRSRPQEFG